MAKQARESGPKASHLKEAVREIERLKGERASQHGSYMQRCAKINGQITNVKDEAKERGIPKKELNALLKKRDLLRKVTEVRKGLEADERAMFDLLESQLGDFGKTPLGQAAIAADRLAKADASGNGHADNRTEQQKLLEASLPQA